MDNMVHSNWWQVQNGVSYITYFYTNYWLGSFFACNYWQIVENNFCCNKTIYFRPQISVALLDIYTLPLGRIQVNSSQYISGNNQIIKTSIPLQISKHPYIYFRENHILHYFREPLLHPYIIQCDSYLKYFLWTFHQCRIQVPYMMIQVLRPLTCQENLIFTGGEQVQGKQFPCYHCEFTCLSGVEKPWSWAWGFTVCWRLFRAKG